MPDASRMRNILVGGVAAMAIGMGFTAVGLLRQAVAPTAVADGPAPVPDVPSLPAPPAGLSLFDDQASPHPPADDQASPHPPGAVGISRSARPPKTSTAPRKARKPRAPAVTTAPPAEDAIVDAVLDHINAARAREGQSALAVDAKLSRAAALHNRLMIDGCGLNHQCPGEAAFDVRFTAQGVQWSKAGENIGRGSSGSSKAQIIAAANGITDGMLAEVPPDDGYRANLLRTVFERIGLSVIRDSKGVVWMTQDFVG